MSLHWGHTVSVTPPWPSGARQLPHILASGADAPLSFFESMCFLLLGSFHHHSQKLQAAPRRACGFGPRASGRNKLSAGLVREDLTHPSETADLLYIAHVQSGPR